MPRDHLEPGGVDPGTSAPLEMLVRAGQVRLAYGRLPLVLSFSVVVSLFFTILLRPVFPTGILWPGLILVYAVSGLRAALWVYYRRVAPAPDQWRLWTRWFMIGTGAAAAAWFLWIFPVLLTAGPAQCTMLLITPYGSIGRGGIIAGPALPFPVSAINGVWRGSNTAAARRRQSWPGG